MEATAAELEITESTFGKGGGCVYNAKDALLLHVFMQSTPLCKGLLAITPHSEWNASSAF